jgi:hypothetical protein
MAPAGTIAVEQRAACVEALGVKVLAFGHR